MLDNIYTLDDFIGYIQSFYKDDEIVKKMISNCLKDTLDRTIKRLKDGSYFVITGDIPAMWLRDSSAQIRPFLFLCKKSKQIKDIVKGIIETQKSQILHDPYANAFNEAENGNGHQDDTTKMTPLLWERKYEIDSLCYPIQLSYLYYKNSNDSSIFDKKYLDMAKLIVETFITEQDHELKSKYRFERTNPGIMEVVERRKYETLARGGLGTPVKRNGLIWSGFRPSDDACQFGYLIPSNMFAVVCMRYLKEIIVNFYQDETGFLEKIDKLEKEVSMAIEKYAVVEKDNKKIYAFEVDGFGNHLLMDDANVPSLLSAPYLGYCKTNSQVYKNTREFILSKNNPFYFEGKFAKGIGSPHTPDNHIWHIALAIEGITTLDPKRKEEILETFKKTTANTYMMHEGFNVDNPSDFSRSWFSWANSMFIEFLLSINNIKLEGLED